MVNGPQVLAAINKIITNPKYADYLAIVKAARNGAVYGAKVRFPHALVMIFLFRSGTLTEKLQLIFKATRTHAQNLAKFATIYKISMLLLRRMGSTPGKEGPYDTFVAGALGGYLIFGQRSPRTGKISSVSQQIVIYVFARVVLAAAKLSVRPEMGLIGPEGLFGGSTDLRAKIEYNAWPAFAAVSWASVMYMFRWYPDTIQSSLQSSMNYIYVQSDHWTDLRTLIWHNK